MRFRLAWAAGLIGGWLVGIPLAAPAAVVIVANRAEREVHFTMTPAPERLRPYAVAPGDLAAVSVDGVVQIAFESGKARRQYQLNPNAAYYFADFPGGLDLKEIGFAASQDRHHAALSGRPPETQLPAAGKVTPTRLRTLTVKILVDQKERAVQELWEKRIRGRLATASAILEHHCHVKLEVVAAAEWESDDALTEVNELLRDFERKVKPEPARLAIGFTSQRLNTAGPNRVGVTRAALHDHILMREWWPPSERGRLEVLLHELGHYLGAAHSAELDSVMRPSLDVRRAVRGNRSPGFDPVNTLVMNLVAEEVFDRGVKQLAGLRPATRQRLHGIYAELGRALPDDPTPPLYLRLLGRTPVVPAAVAPPEALVGSARAVVAALVAAAARNQKLPSRTANRAGGPFRRTGDELTEYYFREAAAAARELPAGQTVPAYLLGLGIALDTSDLMRRNPVTRALWQQVESDDERQGRLAVLGLPTMHDRHDWAQHFVVSAALTARLGARPAEAAGIFKEWLDMQGSSGFTFADLAADLAGIAFAERLRQSPELLGRLATSFTVSQYTISPAGLPDGLTRAEFARDYGSVADARFAAKTAELRKRILARPGHQ
jgi:hypothetical protein